LIVNESIMAELTGWHEHRELASVADRKAMRNKRALEGDSRRNKEQAGAWEFLTTGDTELPSPDGELWSRRYDPLPYPEALPDELFTYEGTGIGALYGLPGSEIHAWQLAGWNLTPRGKEML
jgi:hypothetical protein